VRPRAVLLAVGVVLVAVLVLRRAAAAIANRLEGRAREPETPPLAPVAPASPASSPRVLSTAEMDKLFGPLPWSPVDGNDSAITVEPAWVAQNLVTIDIPQLRDVPGANGGRITVHRVIAERVRALFAEWEQAGLLSRIRSFDGSYAPRRIRGSTSISKHAYGVAFDLNAKANPLGAPAAPQGAEGSLVELAPIAEQHGFFWGGKFKGRPDAMHFEAFR
jgi:hypothetical protein